MTTKWLSHFARRLFRQLGVLFIFLLAGTAGFAAENAVKYPKVNYNSGFDKPLIEKGKYLAIAGDCVACHTNVEPGSVPFAGGLAIETPFGVFYSSNITPDKETGIGNWTEEEFIHAVRHGQAPDGSNYFPVFPYASFNYVEPEDVRAIYAYFMSIPPIKLENKEPGAPWPFSWRFSQHGWRLLFFKDEGPYKPDPTKSEQWNRGAYLVKGLGHCGECHTPRNIFGGLKEDYALTGAYVDGYYAPNISAARLKDVPVADIVRVFKEGKTLSGRGNLGGPMLQAYVDSLRYMEQSDLEAMAIYIKTVESKQPEVSKSSSSGAKGDYKTHCAICHDVGAAGAPKLGDATAWAPIIAQGKDVVYDNAINGINSMPAKGACATCSDDQIREIVDYMVEKAEGGGTASSTAAPVPTLSMADGKRIYQANCASCHGPNAVDPSAKEAPQLGDKARWTTLLSKNNIDILVENTVKGYRRMPPNGGCNDCKTAEIKAAVKYLAQESQDGKDYSLW